MMKNKLKYLLSTFIIILLIHNPSLSQEKKGFQLTVHLDGNYEGNLYLSQSHGYDSVRVESGKAVFTGIQDYPEQLGVILKDYSNVGWVYVENSIIDMYCTYIPAKDGNIHQIKVDTIIGSESQESLYQFYKDIKRLEESGDPEWEYKLAVETMKKSKVIGLWYLTRATDSYTEKEIHSLLDFYAEGEIPEHDMATINRGIERINALNNQMTFDNMNFSNVHGAISLQDKIDKIQTPYKVIHVWGTWCAPCIKQFPSVEQFAIKNQSNATLVGLAIKSDFDQWENLLSKYDLGINEYLEDPSPVNPFTEEYLIDTFPYFLLIDQNNKIILKNTSLAAIEEHVNN